MQSLTLPDSLRACREAKAHRHPPAWQDLREAERESQLHFPLIPLGHFCLEIWGFLSTLPRECLSSSK